jgi:hypothetical protein
VIHTQFVAGYLIRVGPVSFAWWYEDIELSFAVILLGQRGGGE